ncbi:MAG: PA2169 family four-helix-bundle protein [Bacteroidota bacterium]
MSTNNINSNLKDVIERNFDAYQGYQKAAENVDNVELSQTFRNQADQKKSFALQLEAAARVFDEDTRAKLESGTFQGNLHRTWMDIKSAFASNNSEAILEECVRGEKAALEEYNELLNDANVTGEVRQLVADQKIITERNISELQLMEKVVS